MTLTVTHTTPADGTFSATGAAAWDANHALTVSGTSGQVQFNSSGDLAGDAGLTFDSTNKALTVGGGTVTASFPVLSASQTWNNSAVTFTALKLNVTSTNAGTNSKFIDVQKNGSSLFNITVGPAKSAFSVFTYYGVNCYSNEASTTNVVAFGGVTGGLQLASTQAFSFYSGTNLDGAGSFDIFLTRRGAANLRFGAADAAAPVAQTLSVQSVVAGTTNGSAAAYPLTITGSQGTGTGAGGSIVFQVAPAGSSGSAQNGLVNALTIDSNKQLICQADQTLGYALQTDMISPRTQSYLMFQAYLGVRGPGANSGGFGMTQGCTLQWTGTDNINNTADLRLYRDAANTLAQRNGVNAQTFRLYNTYTDASNYERVGVTWSSNVAYIQPQNAGTGSARLLVLSTGTTVVASLPAAATAGAGARAFVTDASMSMTLGVGTTVASGGANKVPVYSDGTNWLIG